MGNVVIEPYSNVNYTAPNSIKLKSGFKAQFFSEFKAVIAPCPNIVNKSAEDFSNDTISAWRLFADYEDEFNEFNNKAEIIIYPNPAQNKLNFTISDELFSDLTAIELYDVLDRKFSYTPAKEIAINELNKGYYTICFVFGSGNKVTKGIIKADN